MEELSAREIEIIELLANGASNKEIALALNISTNTVKVHLRNIYSKLNISSRTEAVLHAIRAGYATANIPNPTHTETAAEVEAETPAEEIPHKAEIPPTPEADTPVQIPYAEGVRPGIKPGWLVSAIGLTLLILLAIYIVINRAAAPEAPPATSPPAPTVTATSAAPRDVISPIWEPMADLPLPLSGLAVLVYDNKIYAIGGESTNKQIAGLAYRYLPDTNTWEGIRQKPTPVSDVEAGVIGGKIYIPGGQTPAGLTASMEVYDPQTDTWAASTPLPKAISGYALAVFEGELYLFGGWDGNQYLAETWKYTPINATWTSLTPLTTPRAYAGAAVVGEKILVMGGLNEQGALALNEAYAPALEGKTPWTPLSDLPEPRARMAVGKLAEDIYIIGGLGTGETHSKIFQYNLSSNRWQSYQSNLPAPWTDLGSTTLNTRLYLIGGSLEQQPVQLNVSMKAIYNLLIPIIP